MPRPFITELSHMTPTSVGGAEEEELGFQCSDSARKSSMVRLAVGSQDATPRTRVVPALASSWKARKTGLRTPKMLSRPQLPLNEMLQLWAGSRSVCRA